MLHKFSSFAACKANARHLDCDSINCVYCKKKKLYSFRIWGMTNNYSPSHSYNYSVRHWQRLIDYLPHCLHSGLMIQLPHRYWSADLFPCLLNILIYLSYWWSPHIRRELVIHMTISSVCIIYPACWQKCASAAIVGITGYWRISSVADWWPTQRKQGHEHRFIPIL